METPAIIFDEFANVSIQPTGSIRTFAGSPGIIMGQSGNKMNFTIPIGGFVFIRYESPDPATTTYDLSDLAIVTMDELNVSQPALVTLELEDSDGMEDSVPIGVLAGTADVEWNIQTQFAINNQLDLENIIRIEFTIENEGGDVLSGNTERIFSTLICVAKDTMVLMADGTEKPIQHIKRGDEIAGDLEIKTINKVARLLHTQMAPITPVNIVKINENALEPNLPNRDLFISGIHPIFYNGQRRKAKLFRTLKGINYFGIKNNTTAADILPIDDNGETYSLYNIQYEHDGYFVANGIVVDSVPVLSNIMPLPKELYFNPELYGVKQITNIPKLKKSFF